MVLERLSEQARKLCRRDWGTVGGVRRTVTFIMPVLSVTKRFENLGQGQLRALPVKGIVWGLFNHPGCDEYQI
jgi:hypothetical protein